MFSLPNGPLAAPPPRHCTAGAPLKPGSSSCPGPGANPESKWTEQGEGRRGIPGPSPSYLGSEPSVGKSIAGGAGKAPAPSPSASRSRPSELPPSIAGPARAAAQDTHQPAPPQSSGTPIAYESGSSLLEAEDWSKSPAPSLGGRAWRGLRPLPGAGWTTRRAPVRRRPTGLILPRPN